MQLWKTKHVPTIDSVMAARSKDVLDAFVDQRYVDLARVIDSNYYPWRKVRYIASDKGLDAEVLWAIVKMTRVSASRLLPLYGPGTTPLRFNLPDSVQEELMFVDQDLGGKLTASDDQPISQAHQERFVISALREEAIASSMLEGASTTRRKAKEMLASGRKPATTGERMVLNNYLAMKFILEHRHEDLSPELLLQIQAILTENTLDQEDEVGRFRTANDQVDVVDRDGQVVHNPPPASELPARLKRFCDFANGTADGGRFVHPLVRAISLHFQIGFDHPFCDGNGRTARAVFYWAMLKAGYWLFEYLAISRLIYNSPSQYGMAYLYTETDEFDLTYFLAYNVRVVRLARRDLHEYIARKQAEMMQARRIFEADYRLNHRQREAILLFTRAPAMHMDIQEHQDRHHTAYATARRDLLELVKWEYLIQIKDGNRYVFKASSKMTSNPSV
jgi:Fic family protein